MDKTYETPAVADLGDFRAVTGEFIGPHDEAILPFEDYSNEG
ncbi:keywimysin-related RiPP [Kineococcus sp. SYSU DK001]